jgi:hypothetical protein
MESENAQNEETYSNQKAPNLDQIMDLPRLSIKSNITHSDIILSILEICTFNKKYNYECSNNTKAFWDRVVEEGILKKIFKDFKSETLRKYWKIIRQTGDNDKFIEVVKQNEKFINNPVLKLLPIINTISTYIITPPKNQNFEDYFISLNPKEMKELQKVEPAPTPEKKEKKLKIKKIEKTEKIEKEESEKNIVDPKILEMGSTIEKLMKMTNATEENVLRALYGCTGNVKNAYLFLKDNKKYEKYFFFHTDDYIIKNLKNKNYYIDLLNKKGEDNVKIREKFLKKK